MNVKSIILQKLLVFTFLIFGMVNQVVANKGDKRTAFISKQTQEEFVTGTVTDAFTNETLLGVNVIIHKKDIGTASNFDGEYKIKANPGDVLEFSYVGYTTKQIVVTKPNEVINIQLEESKGTLEEVIVVGYKKKQIKDITEAAVNISQVEELSTRPIINSEEILQGTASGVTVINDGGDPTKSPVIRVRGIGSLNKEEPLIVVDGVPELPMPSPIDIRSIIVLKDASASIYGARAAGGVILVETKKGSQKTSITLNTYTGFQSVINSLKPLSTRDYIDVRNIAFDNDGVPKDDPKRASVNELESKINTLPNNNWIDLIFRNGIIKNYDLSFSGGSDASRFYVGLNHRDIEGILLNSYIRKSSIRLNSDFKIGNNLTIGENLAVTHTNGNYGIDTQDPYQGAIFTAVSTRSLYPVRDEDGEFSNGDADLRNPVQYLVNKDDKRPTINVAGNLFLKYTFFENFTFKTSLGINKEIEQTRHYKEADGKDGNRFLERRVYDQFSWLTENTLSYDKLIGTHNLGLLIGHASQRNEAYRYGVRADNYPKLPPNLRYLDYQVEPKHRHPFGRKPIDNSLLSYFGRLDYSFDSKYYLTALVRRDGSSKLHPKNRWGTFPSISIAWKPSNETFLKDVSWINDLKLRASYGRLGNVAPLGDFDYKEDATVGGSFTLINNEWVSGIISKRASNPDLKWEESVHTNVGLDGTLLDNSFYFSFDYFIKDTEKMLLESPEPGDKGFEDPSFKNVGLVRNKGFEALVGYRKNNEDFGFDVSANVSFVRNEVKDLGNLEEILHRDRIKETVREQINPLKSIVGESIRSYYVIETDGIFQSQSEVDAYVKDGNKIQPNARPGDLKFVDANGDGKIDDKDRIFKGNAFPDVTFGLNFSANYKNFDLSMLWQGALGVEVINGLKYMNYRPFAQDYNMLSQAKDAWSPLNTGSSIPRLTVEDPNQNYSRTSDFFLEDASYARLKNITLGYSIPSIFNKDFDARLYITGKNVLTFTKYSGFDPEVSTTGIDNGYYPSARSFILGATLKF